MSRTNFTLVTAFLLCQVIACGKESGAGHDGNSQHQNEASGNPPVMQQSASEDLPVLSFSGGERGNGGDAVVCFSDTAIQSRVRASLGSSPTDNPFADPDVLAAVSSVVTLDQFEYQLPAGFPPVSRQTVDVNEPVSVSVPKILTRLKGKSGLGLELERQWQDMPLGNWIQASGVVEINDSAQAFLLPPHCLLIQAAVRIANKVYYDRYLWDRMSEQARALLVVHELVYKLAAERGASSSQTTRPVVGLITSKDELDSLEGWEVYNQLTKIGKFAFPMTIGNSRLMVESVVSQFPNGYPEQMKVRPATIVAAGKTWQLDSLERNSGVNLVISEQSEVRQLFGTKTQSDKYWTEDPVLVDFAAGTILKMTSVIRESVTMHAGTAVWGIKYANFAGGELSDLEGAGSFFAPNVGSVSLSGRITFDQAGEVVRHASEAKIQITDYFSRGYSAVFDSDGNLTEMNSARLTSSFCDRNPLDFSSGVGFTLCTADIGFYADGSVSFLRYHPANPEDIGNATWNFQGSVNMEFQRVSEITFFPGNIIDSVKFSANGLLKHSVQYPEYLDVRFKTIQIREGKVIIL